MQEWKKADLEQHTLEYLADMRDYQLERVQLTTEVLKTKVAEAHQDGSSVTELAKKAGVTRRTIQQWTE